jgi:hypothetical protein
LLDLRPLPLNLRPLLLNLLLNLLALSLDLLLFLQPENRLGSGIMLNFDSWKLLRNTTYYEWVSLWATLYRPE